MKRWAIITGEYPPQTGGVSDYTRLVAEGLARAGDDVHVWCPCWPGQSPPAPGIQVHRLPDHFGPRGLARLDAGLRDLPRDTRLLVQYVPHAYGCKAMNVPFCWWLQRQRRLPTWLMVHEAAFPLGWGQPVRHMVLGVVTRLMAFLAVRASRRLFVTVPAWRPLLERYVSAGCPIDWLPVPSTLPTEVDPARVRAVRERVAGRPGALVLGHFGTFGPSVAAMVRSVLPAVLRRDENAVALLIGRSAENFANTLREEHLDLAGRLRAAEGLPAAEVADHLAACDVLFQPYPDGVSTRRTTVMSGLALGLPVVTNEGPLSEPLWRASQAVALADGGSPEAMTHSVEFLLRDGPHRNQLGQRARQFYGQHFQLDRVIRVLRSPA
jgi:glycosyltransferase involved in cell wall biosynthesis